MLSKKLEKADSQKYSKSFTKHGRYIINYKFTMLLKIKNNDINHQYWELIPNMGTRKV